jgi:Phage portal protein, SPP1 Gp6-like.
MTKEELYSYNEHNFTELYNLISPILAHRNNMFERYSRKLDPAVAMGKGEKSMIPFEFYITNIVEGYLSGKEPKYSVSKGKNTERDEKYIDTLSGEIDSIRRYNDDGALYAELMHNYATTTATYLYVYESEDNEIVYSMFDGRQTVAIYDYNTPANLIGVVRTWSERDKNVQDAKKSIELITDTARTRFVEGKGIVESEILQWGDVPCSPMEEPDGIAVFEPAVPLIELYEQLIGNMANMTQYNDEAKLLLVGYTLPPASITSVVDGIEVAKENPARAIEEKNLLNSKVLMTDENGDIRWLLKNVDYTGNLDVLKRLHDLITMVTGVPNMTDEAFARADNASALGYKLYALDQYSASTDRIFRKAYLRLWELIVNRLNLKAGTEKYDFRDIDIIMQRNVPTDRDKSIERAAKMKSSGLFSDETSINESGIEVDAKTEIDRRVYEENEQYETVSARMTEQSDD